MKAHETRDADLAHAGAPSATLPRLMQASPAGGEANALDLIGRAKRATSRRSSS